MGNGFGSSQEPEAQHGWESWCIIDTHNLPGTAVLVRKHDQDSSNSSSPAKTDPLVQTNSQAVGEGSPENSFAPPPRVKSKPFRRTTDPQRLWQTPAGNGTWVPAVLTHFSSTREQRSGAGLIPTSLCTTILQQKLYLLLFLCVYTHRCREGCFVPVYTT